MGSSPHNAADVGSLSAMHPIVLLTAGRLGWTAGSGLHSRSEILACPGRGKLRKDDHHSNELKVFRNHSIPERYQSAHLRRRDMQKLDGSETCRPTAARSSTWDRRITCGRNLVDSLSSRLKRGSFRPPKIGSPDPRLAWTSTSVDDQGFVPGTR